MVVVVVVVVALVLVLLALVLVLVLVLVVVAVVVVVVFVVSTSSKIQSLRLRRLCIGHVLNQTAQHSVKACHNSIQFRPTTPNKKNVFWRPPRLV